MPKNGTRFGSFELIRRLALGGMAEIFLARERGIEGIERQLVVKRILPQYTSSRRFRAMFAEEAQLGTSPDDPDSDDDGEDEGGDGLSRRRVPVGAGDFLGDGPPEPAAGLPPEQTEHVARDVGRYRAAKSSR